MKKNIYLAVLAATASMVGNQSAFAAATSICTNADASVIETTITAIQGSSYVSPFLADQVTSKEALIDATYETEALYKVTGVVSSEVSKGYLLYAADNDPSTSDGIYVYMDNYSHEVKPKVGETVCVVGKIKEYKGLTQISPSNFEWEVVDATSTAPDPVDFKVLDSETSFSDALERYEGMLVKLTEDLDDYTDGHQDMRVSRTFSFDFELANATAYKSTANNIALSYSRINMHPNQIAPAGSEESIALRNQNVDYTLFLKADAAPKNGVIDYYPEFTSDPMSNYIRVNDSVVNVSGAVLFEDNRYTMLVPWGNQFKVSQANFIHNSPRIDSPPLAEEVGFDKFTVRIATQNLLNYFNSDIALDEIGQANRFGENRGAESQEEFELQTKKLVTALYKMDADVISLLEIENNGFGEFSAITKLQNELNKMYTEELPKDRGKQNYVGNRYAFVAVDSNGDTIIDQLDHIGYDAISTGFFYRPSKMTLVNTRVINMPSQHASFITDDMGAALVDRNGEFLENGDNYHRDSLLATFLVHGTGKRLTVVANHFKSKGSTCWEDWQGWDRSTFDPLSDTVPDSDYQGNCEQFRVSAAMRLAEELEKVGGDRIILGDLNSYAYEDAMLVLTSNPTNKTLTAASKTYLGKEPFHGSNGATLKNFKGYGYINAAEQKDHEKNQESWSFSYNNEVGSLDHILITPSLQDNLVDAVEWHINAAESTLFDYTIKYKGDFALAQNISTESDRYNPYRSSDHDPAIMTLAYRYGETGESDHAYLTADQGMVSIPYIIPDTAGAQVNDIAVLKINGLQEDESRLAIPRIKLTQDGPQTVIFNVAGLNKGKYTVEMSLIKGVPVDPAQESQEGKQVTGANASMRINVQSSDTLEPTFVVPEYDGTGGGGPLGGLAILSLLSVFGFRQYSGKRK